MCDDQSKHLCPSWKCEDGALLLGVIGPDGTVSFIKDQVTIDDAFVSVAKEGRSPEARFRFGHRCLMTGCAQWKDSKCSVIDQVIEAAPSDLPEAALPECSIRSDCRWFFQHGVAACRVCPYVVTDNTDALH